MIEVINTEIKEKITELIRDALWTDGEHQKQWYLWRLAEELCIDEVSLNQEKCRMKELNHEDT